MPPPAPARPEPAKAAPLTPPRSVPSLVRDIATPSASPPVQPKPEPAPAKAEPVAPAESVVEKARRAIGQLRRRIAPQDEPVSKTEVVLPAAPVTPVAPISAP